MNINPNLSDIEDEERFPEDSKNFPLQAKKLVPSQKDLYEIECEGVDTLLGSQEEGNTIQSERFLKMSHISTKKSNSTNSNIQDCQDLVNGLENGCFSMHVEENRKFGIIEGQKSVNLEAKKFKEDESMPSFDLNTKQKILSKEEKGSITIIKSKIVPTEMSSQMQICELVTKSIEVEDVENSENKIHPNTCTGLSEETTQITRIKSESQKSNCSQLDKLLNINITKN